METKEAYRIKLENAKKRVDAIKKFYSHAQTYLTVLIIVSVLYLIKAEPIIRVREAINEELLSWIDLNIWVNLGIWALILLIHGLVAFKFPYRLIQKWEERQLKKLLEEDQ